MSILQQTYPVSVLCPALPRLLQWPLRLSKSSFDDSEGRVFAASRDEQLIDATLQGDERAFRYLVERYQAHVARTVTGMLGKTQDVDDCVQDVFIRLYGSLTRFRGESSVKTYVTRIAVNRSLDVLRKRQRSFFVPWDRSAVENIESDAPRPDDTLVYSDQRIQLRQALDSLSSRHRTVVVLRLIDGMSTSETADVLGVPYGTVLSRLKRALGKMKKAFGENSGLTEAGLRSGKEVLARTDTGDRRS